jgi:hypothetical protein
MAGTTHILWREDIEKLVGRLAQSIDPDVLLAVAVLRFFLMDDVIEPVEVELPSGSSATT